MLAMQYTIQLPDDYDPADIAERVATRRHLFDAMDGMAHKTFLYNATDNLYAPFYVWENEEAARQFLLDDAFKGVEESFNRPRVRQWHVISATYGKHTQHIPGFAMCEADIIACDQPLSTVIAHETQHQQALVQHNPHLYYHVIALDVERWELVRYSVWHDAQSAPMPESDCAQSYDVLHVSGAPAQKRSESAATITPKNMQEPAQHTTRANAA